MNNLQKALFLSFAVAPLMIILPIPAAIAGGMLASNSLVGVAAGLVGGTLLGPVPIFYGGKIVDKARIAKLSAMNVVDDFVYKVVLRKPRPDKYKDITCWNTGNKRFPINSRSREYKEIWQRKMTLEQYEASAEYQRLMSGPLGERIKKEMLGDAFDDAAASQKTPPSPPPAASGPSSSPSPKA